jgi:hypothetical protein
MTHKNHRLFVLFVLLLVLVSQNTPAQDLLAVADSTAVQPDSVPKNPNAIDAPILYAAKDSMVMVMKDHNMIYMFGEGSVKYKNLDLTGEYIEVDADNDIVYATFALDSIGEEFGYPVFKEGDTQYEMKKARYNFKTKKMRISEVITQQGEGFVTAAETKKMPNDELFMRNGRYTTCDEHEHPHFYLQMTKAKVQPGKRIVTGPAYLVVEDVPLPVAVPFGFFPFTSDYSSGVIMPTYGDEMKRGFSLRDGGYYFAFSDYVDLALTGEIYTKLSWGVNARSSYRKRYKYSGNFQASYLVTKLGDKGEIDYSKSKDFKLVWNHSQDAKANPFSTFSAHVDFSTSSYDRNDLTSLYSNQYTQNTKASSINYSYRPPGSPFSFSANMSVNQISKTQSLSMTLPGLTISMSDVYPFRRKEQIGSPQWYENIKIRYTGSLSNSLNAQESEFFKKNLIKDWRNGMKHDIPVMASFNLFKYITVTPSVNYTERWYLNRIDKQYNYETHQAVVADTTRGFYRVWDYNASISANTKLYGMFKPWGIFGEWTKKTQIRHVMTPSVSFTGAPDFSDKKYGYYQDLYYLNEQTGKLDTLSYSRFSEPLYGVPGKGKSGSLSFNLDNNLEMKIPIAGTDSTRKVSLIDLLHLGIGYNFLADSLNWSDLSAGVRFKFGKYTLSLQGNFDTYLYNEKAEKINKTRLEAGKGIGRLISTGTSFSYTLNNETIKKLLGKGDKKDTSGADTNSDIDVEQADAAAVENNVDNPPQTSLRKPKKSEGDYDDDGYLLTTIPWSLSINYSMGYGYDRSHFNKDKREYPYKFTNNMGLSGSISPTKGWSFNFNTSYDFDNKRFATMQCSITRQMHCWTMSASVIPVGPYQSYNFTIAVSSSMLKDLKYTQSSNFRDAMNWGD